jgi:hypothetical protein
VRHVTGAGTVAETTDGEVTAAVNEPTADWPTAVLVAPVLVAPVLVAVLVAALLGAAPLAAADAGVAPSEVATAWAPRQAVRPAIRASALAEMAAALASRPVDERVMAHSSGMNVALVSE